VHGDLVGRFVVRIECDRLLRGGERTCWVAVVEAEVSELAEEVDDRCVEAADVAGRPGVVGACERLAADERERPLEQRFPVGATSRVRPGEQLLELIEIDRDCLTVEEVALVRAEDALPEVSAGVTDCVPFRFSFSLALSAITVGLAKLTYRLGP
jgi:hypothetical protein